MQLHRHFIRRILCARTSAAVVAASLALSTQAFGAPYLGTPYTGSPLAVPGIVEAENFDLGGEGIAYHDNTAGNQGGQYRLNENVDIFLSNDPLGGGYIVKNFENGEWLNYTISVPSAGNYAVDIRAVTNPAFPNTAFHIEVDGVNATGTVVLPTTDPIGWSNYQWVGKETVTLGAGTHVLKIVSEQQYFGLNSIRVAAAADPTPFSGTPIAVPGIFEAENFDLGGEGVGYHDNTAGNQGGQYRLNEDVDIFLSNDPLGGGYVVKNFENGEWLNYTINVPASGSYDIDIRAVTNPAFPNTAFHIEVDGVKVTGSVVLPTTDTVGWNNYGWIGKTTVRLAAGTHYLKLVSDQQYFGLNSIRVAATPVAVDPSTVTFFCTFPGSPSDCGFGEQSAVPGRATIVNVGRDGPTAVRLHTEPGDSNVAGSGINERDDLTPGTSASYCNQGQEEWWAHSILFPDDYVDPPESTDTTWNWGVVFDFHNSGSGGGQANFQINAWPTTALYSDRPTGLGFQIAFGSQTSSTVYRFPIGPVVRDVWYDFVYHVKWSSNTDGFFTAWVNGVKKMDYAGPTIYPGQSCYLKLANYHTPFGQPSSVIHDRIIRGTVPGAVSLTPLEGILP